MGNAPDPGTYLPRSGPLSEKEKQVLKSGGARLSGPSCAQEAERARQEVAHMLLKISLDVASVADLLGITRAEITEMATEHPPELYSFKSETSELRFPEWQFSPDAGNTIPYLREILLNLAPTVHPVTVSRFMLEPCVDLVEETSGRRLSPRQWLLMEFDPDPILLIIQDL